MIPAVDGQPPVDGSRHGEILLEQGYADWAYERLEAELDDKLALQNAGMDRAARRSLAEWRQQRVEKIRAALADTQGLLIGRLDMITAETWYIGRHSVDGDDRQPAVIDWRADLAKRFYQATASSPEDIGRRRTISMRGRTVSGVADEILVDGFATRPVLPEVARPPAMPVLPRPAGPAEPRPPEAEPAAAPVHWSTDAVDEDEPDIRAQDLLLAELDRDRTGALEDIVATIQADQDRVIRSPVGSPLIVQGGPGTGKTIVGLHRAAWVLYEQRRALIAQSVLVVGPNPRFIQYIGGVLPSLGESDVRQLTIDDLAVDGLPASDRDRVAVGAVDPPTVARIKGDPRMAPVVRAAVWSRVRPVQVSFPYGRMTLRLDTEHVDSAIGRAWLERLPYADARRRLVEELAEALAEEYARRIASQGRAPGAAERREVATAARAHLRATRQATTIMPAVTARGIVQWLFAEPQQLARVATALSPGERELLYRPPRRVGRSVWTSADLPLLDEAAASISGPPVPVGHLVIDEAQDLSPMQWRVVKRRSPQGSMTILGDLAQATSPWSPASWRSVISWAGLDESAKVTDLMLGYRVPSEILEFATPLVLAASPGVRVPRSFRSTDPPVVLRATARSLAPAAATAARERLDRGAVAIIAPADLLPAITSSLGALAPVVTMLEPESAKGLEFDVVVVAAPEVIAREGPAGLRLLYVALTRSTKELVVVHAKPLPAALGESPAERLETTLTAGR